MNDTMVQDKKIACILVNLSSTLSR